MEREKKYPWSAKGFIRWLEDQPTRQTVEYMPAYRDGVPNCPAARFHAAADRHYEVPWIINTNTNSLAHRIEKLAQDADGLTYGPLARRARETLL